MSNEHDEIRARYEAAMEVMPSAERQTLKLEAVATSLADIPRLLQENERLKEAFDASLDSTEKAEREAFDLRVQLAEKEKEVERLNIEEQLYRLSYQGLLLELNKALELENQLPSELLKHIATLRAQLVGRDAEVERLEGILQSATETFTAAQLGKEPQIESLSTENKRLREALRVMLAHPREVHIGSRRIRFESTFSPERAEQLREIAWPETEPKGKDVAYE